MNLSTKLWQILSMLLFSFSGAAIAGQVTQEMELPYKFISFIVKDAKSDQPFSEGREDIKFENGFMTKTTKYWLFGDASKNIVQEETCSFELKTLRPRAYKFQNIKSGEFVSLTGVNEKSFAENLRYKDAADKPEVSGTFAWQPGMIFGKTPHHFIVRAWDKLIKDQHESFPLYVPMKRDQYMFRVAKKSEKKEGDTNAYLISLEPDNWAFRQLAPAMSFYYGEKNNIPRLLRYEGPTTVVVDSNSDRKVMIEFAYDSEILGVTR